MSLSPPTESPKLPAGEQAVLDALLGLMRNGKDDATAPELRETIEQLGLYRVNGSAVHRIEKGWVTGRLNELHARGMVLKAAEPRRNPATGRLATPWMVPAKQAEMFTRRVSPVSKALVPNGQAMPS